MMALLITDECINCGYCEKECPRQAIYEPGMKWAMAEGTELRTEVRLNSGRPVGAWELQPSLSDTFYYIVPEKCDECNEYFGRPQCTVVCPNPTSINRC